MRAATSHEARSCIHERLHSQQGYVVNTREERCLSMEEKPMHVVQLVIISESHFFTVKRSMVSESHKRIRAPFATWRGLVSNRTIGLASLHVKRTVGLVGRRTINYLLDLGDLEVKVFAELAVGRIL